MIVNNPCCSYLKFVHIHPLILYNPKKFGIEKSIAIKLANTSEGNFGYAIKMLKSADESGVFLEKFAHIPQQPCASLQHAYHLKILVLLEINPLL